MRSYVFPGDIDPALMEIGAKPFLYMRTQEFSDINLESERILLDLIHCTDHHLYGVRDRRDERGRGELCKYQGKSLCH